MPNINFPSNPTASQTYTFNGATWTFNGVAWTTSQPGFGPQGPTGPGTGGSSLSIPLNQIVFGTGSGVTSSSIFTFNNSTLSIIGSTNSSNSACRGIILGGYTNNISSVSNDATIIGSRCSTIRCNSSVSSIIGSLGSTHSFSKYGSIISGRNNQINGDAYYFSYDNSIVAGNKNCMNYSCNSIILGGCLNYMAKNPFIYGGGFANSSILSGCSNKVYGDESSIISGCMNIINYGISSIIGGGNCNTIQTSPGGLYLSGLRTCRSSIIGGLCNRINGSCEVVILGGERNTLVTSNDAAIIAGNGLSFSSVCQRVIVPTLILASASIARPHINFIAGASPSSPQNGDMWYDGTNFWIRSGSQSLTLPGSTASTNNAASNLFLFYNY